MIDETVEGYVTGATEGFPEEWDLDALWTALKQLYPVSFTRAQFEEEHGGREALDRDLRVARLREGAGGAVGRRPGPAGGPAARGRRGGLRRPRGRARQRGHARARAAGAAERARPQV